MVVAGLNAPDGLHPNSPLKRASGHDFVISFNDDRYGHFAAQSIEYQVADLRSIFYASGDCRFHEVDQLLVPGLISRLPTHGANAFERANHGRLGVWLL